MAAKSLLQNRVVLFLSPQNLVVLSYSLQNRVAPYLLQSRVVYSLFTLEPHGLFFSPPKPCGPPHLLRSRVVSSFLWLLGLGLNPSAHLPLQPQF